MKVLQLGDRVIFHPDGTEEVIKPETSEDLHEMPTTEAGE